MVRTAALLALALAGCAHEAQGERFSVSSVQLSGGAGSITYASPAGKGTITVAPPIVVRMESVQVNSDSTQHWTIDGATLDFAGPELMLGGASYGSIRGEARIEIREGGVFVNGEKRGELAR
jgi:hypothetical protein